MPVKKGDKVKVDYTGTLDDGTVFDSSTHDGHSHPLEFEVGSGQIIKGFDEAVIGMEPGDEKDIHIDAKDAYGDPNSELIQKVPREQLPKEDLKKGMMLAMNMPNGQQLPGTIKEVSEKEVTIDFNHPLAGKALNFKIKLVEIVSK